MIAVTGYRTTIAQELSQFDQIERLDTDRLPRGIDKFVLAAGLLHGKRLLDLSPVDAYETVQANMVSPMRLCERILAEIPTARICVIGSCSGIKGSFDELYAASKAGLHQYVKTRKVGERQQLVAVAPIIIADSGMTRRRSDYPEVLETRKTVTAREVAAIVYGLLTMIPVVSNQVIPVGEC